jgi:hypothetical protein
LAALWRLRAAHLPLTFCACWEILSMASLIDTSHDAETPRPCMNFSPRA